MNSYSRFLSDLGQIQQATDECLARAALPKLHGAKLAKVLAEAHQKLEIPKLAKSRRKLVVLPIVGIASSVSAYNGEIGELVAIEKSRQGFLDHIVAFREQPPMVSQRVAFQQDEILFPDDALLRRYKAKLGIHA